LDLVQGKNSGSNHAGLDWTTPVSHWYLSGALFLEELFGDKVLLLLGVIFVATMFASLGLLFYFFFFY
jgi:hypothetical protein